MSDPAVYVRQVRDLLDQIEGLLSKIRDTADNLKEGDTNDSDRQHGRFAPPAR